MKSSLLILLVGLLPVPTAPSSERPCRDVHPEARRVECLKAQYQSADRELNEIYQSLRTRLSPEEQSEMKQDSIRWISIKEGTCEMWMDLDATREAASQPEYWECLLNYTVERSAYLKSAFGREGVPEGLEGTYDDGVDGTLELTRRSAESEEFSFTLDVVRGPTAHTGSVEGFITPKDGTAVYENRTECGDQNELCCRLRFRIEPYRITVEEESCSYFHGVRAYFGGIYRKIGPADAVRVYEEE